MLYMLEDHFLLDCYRSAMELRLDDEFLQLLLQEIQHRQLDSGNRGPNVKSGG